MSNGARCLVLDLRLHLLLIYVCKQRSTIHSCADSYILLLFQLGEWVFVASGTGLVPQAQEPVSVYTVAGSNTTLIIPFRNPMDHAVLCEVILRGKHTCLFLHAG